MAVRTPSTFNEYVDIKSLVSRKPILVAAPSAVADDQQLAVDTDRLILSDVFTRQVTAQEAAASMVQYNLLGRNTMGISANGDTEVCLLAWASDASDFMIAAYDQINTTWRTLEITANHTDKVWRGWLTGTFIYEDGTLNVLDFCVYRTSGSGTITLAGIGMFSV